jgi:hypothetical protein
METLAMADKFVHNNPRDIEEQRFESLKAQVTDISHNMNLLMEDIASKIKPFRYDVGS